MFRYVSILAAAGLYGTAAGLFAADADWQFDKIVLTNGAVLRGLILEETPTGVRFQNVRRQPGRPTVVFSTNLSRGEIAGVERLSAADRKRLQDRLKEIENAGPAEKLKEELLALEAIDWGGKAGAGRRYQSELFVLESDAPEWIVRRAAGRLEQVYAAYTRFLPPRSTEAPNPPGPPTVIELFQSRAGYEARLAPFRRLIVNVACYDPAANRVFCYSNLERLAAEIERLRKEHQKLRADLDREEKEATRLYRGADSARVMAIIRDTRKRLDAAEWQNEGEFDQSTRQLFAALGHEAFHAYLANVVYPPPAAGPPLWLNEGLAQIFETAVVEAGELRIGHADRDRLRRAKEAVRKGGLVPLAKLLRSTPKEFLAVHAADKAATDVHYLTAWAVAFHLTFDRKLLGTTYLDRYFKALDRGTDAEAAFADLVGRPVAEYEKSFQEYLSQLQPDGTLTPGPK